MRDWKIGDGCIMREIGRLEGLFFLLWTMFIDLAHFYNFSDCLVCSVTQDLIL
jgi:hypothetical protein